MKSKEINNYNRNIQTYFNNLFSTLFKPQTMFKKLKEISTKETILYSLFISVIIYIVYFLKIIFMMQNDDLPLYLQHFSSIFGTSLNLWVILYFLFLGVMIFLAVLVASLIISGLVFIFVKIKNDKALFADVWKLIMLSLTPLVLDQILGFILYLSGITIPYISYLFYVYVIVLIVIGLNLQNTGVKGNVE